MRTYLLLNSLSFADISLTLFRFPGTLLRAKVLIAFHEIALFVRQAIDVIERVVVGEAPMAAGCII
jgi:hypothetical protein